MATYKQFEDLPVWRAAIEMAVSVFRLTARESFRFKGDLVNQCRRAALSVSNNIAEGFERGTTAELISYLYIARGSAGEVRSMLRFALELGDMAGEAAEINRLIGTCEAVSRQIRAWLDSLQNSDIKGQRHLNDESRASYENNKERELFEMRLADLLAPRGSSLDGDDGAGADAVSASAGRSEIAPGSSGETPSCPLCGKPMAKRRSKSGKEFWGCTKYPDCKGSRSL